MNKLIALVVSSSLFASAAFAEEKKSACRLMDETGTVVLQHESEGTTIKCQFEIREEIKKQRCESGKKLTFTYVGQGGTGKDLKPIQMNITCPRR
ncbi:MAG: hypothetical protein QM817_25440 [Archangium sp.]